MLSNWFLKKWNGSPETTFVYLKTCLSKGRLRQCQWNNYQLTRETLFHDVSYIVWLSISHMFVLHKESLGTEMFASSGCSQSAGQNSLMRHETPSTEHFLLWEAGNRMSKYWYRKLFTRNTAQKVNQGHWHEMCVTVSPILRPDCLNLGTKWKTQHVWRWSLALYASCWTCRNISAALP
jgi:hypothetical protein